MRADKSKFSLHTIMNEEVTMVRRFALLVIVLAAFLILAVPAFAANGARADYTTSNACATCHQSDGVPFDAPKVYNDWAQTKHGIDSEAVSAAKSLPYGSVCAGCHTANYDPTKVSPVPTATTFAFNTATPTPQPTKTTVAWGPDQIAPTLPQAQGNAPMSELDVGCSSCHYGANVASNSSLVDTGNDVNDTAHTAAYYNDLANGEICGACHSRYSYTTNTYTVLPIPTATATPTTLIQPQMAIAYPMIGASYAPLSQYLNEPFPGWTPTPNPTVTGNPALTPANFGQLQTYWTVDGVTTPWQQTGHDGSAAQYPEWLNNRTDLSGHANSLKVLLAEFPTKPAFLNSCLECHSTDYRIAKEAGKTTPTIATAKYGITCVGCHAPHNAGTAKGAWDEEFDAQLVGDPQNSSDLCTTCHNAEITGVAAAGAALHHTTKEVMDGTGAIGVPQGLPGVHKGKCVECHMPPTSFSRGSAQLGGNHTFQIITPKDAVDASPVPVVTSAATTTPTPNSTPWTSPTPIVTTYVDESSMPYSACSTCHNNKVMANATPQPIATVTTNPTPAAGKPITVTVTRVMQNQGDKGLWLQDTIDQRQTAMLAKYNNVGDALHQAGLRMGYQEPPVTGGKTLDPDDDASYVNWLNGVLNTKGASAWSPDELNWQRGFTDWSFVAAEGSMGVHNYQYDSLVIQAALNYATMVDKTPQTVTLKLSKTSVKKNTKVTFSGTVKPATAGTITIQKKSGSNWLTWKTAKVSSTGSYSLTVKMTSKGTFYFRSFFPANPSYAGGTSGQVKVVVKK
jgi:hypothetical protein